MRFKYLLIAIIKCLEVALFLMLTTVSNILVSVDRHQIDKPQQNYSYAEPGRENRWVTGGTNHFIGKNQDWIWWGDFLVRGAFNPLFNILKSHFFGQVWFSLFSNPRSVRVLQGIPPHWLSLILHPTKWPEGKIQS